MATAQRSRTTAAVRAKAREDGSRIERISRTLEAAQKDLGAIGGSVGTGVRDLRRDVNKLLRDAQRHLAKMSRAVERDLERLQKDVSSASTAKKAGAKREAPTKARQTPRRSASSSR